MTELMAHPEASAPTQEALSSIEKTGEIDAAKSLVEGYVSSFYSQLLDRPGGRDMGRFAYLGDEHPDSTDDELIAAAVDEKLDLLEIYSSSRPVSEAVSGVIVDAAYGFLHDEALAAGTGENLRSGDFAVLHGGLELLASETDFFDPNREGGEKYAADALIESYVRAVRLFVTSNPSGGDILVADTEGSRNAFRTYLSVESALAGDFETAESMLADIDGDTEGAFEKVLLEKLHQAKADFEERNPVVTAEASARQLASKRELDLDASEATIEKVNQANPHITVGTTLDVLADMVSPGGRYMTPHEMNIISQGHDGAKSERRKGHYAVDYARNRQRLEADLGYSLNPFSPRVVYGALTSDLEPDRGSGYGPVVIHMRGEVTDDPRTGFNVGDSLTPSGRSSAPLTAEDAMTAYTALAEHKMNSEMGHSRYSYIEAHMPGLSLENIDKVSIRVDSNEGLRDISEVVEIVDSAIERGVGVEIMLNADSAAGEWVQLGTEHYMQEEGLTEEAALDKMLTILRSRFESAQSPLLSFGFFFEKSKSRMPRVRDRMNKELFKARGAAVYEPEIVGAPYERNWYRPSAPKE